VSYRAELALAALLAVAPCGCSTVRDPGPPPAVAPDAPVPTAGQPSPEASAAPPLPPHDEDETSIDPWHAHLDEAEEHDDEEGLEDAGDEAASDDEDWQSLTASARCQGRLDQASCPLAHARSPLADLSEDEIRRRLREDPSALGPLSIGAASRGRLMNGVRMPDGERWTLTDPAHAWGTPETVESLVRAIDRVHAVHPATQPLVIGHLSAKNGGRLRPHKSHQSGRDVDLGFYYADPTKGWYAVANAKNLDRARTWTLTKALLESGMVEMILVDTSIQKLLRDHALAAGEDPAFVDEVFQISGKSKWPLVRHAKGHATHLHVRFYSPVAQASARIAAPYLPKPAAPADERAPSLAKSRPGTKPGQPGSEPREADYILHRARSGDTLDALARRYGTTVEAIKRANGIVGNAIKQKHVYRIPKPPGSAPPPKAASPRDKGSAKTPATSKPTSPSKKSSSSSSKQAGRR
jgi:penicillin-insensitive murein endopeptidase